MGKGSAFYLAKHLSYWFLSTFLKQSRRFLISYGSYFFWDDVFHHVASSWSLLCWSAKSIAWTLWGEGGLCAIYIFFSYSESKSKFQVLSPSRSLCFTTWKIMLDLDYNLSNIGCQCSLLYWFVFQCLCENKEGAWRTFKDRKSCSFRLALMKTSS